MSKGLYREFYLLPRGEQRALVLLSLLLILSLLFRVLVGVIPERESPGMEEFGKEAAEMMATIARFDSIQQAGEDSIRKQLSGSAAYVRSSSYPLKKEPSVFPIDINRADSLQLLPLPGIGPVFARRIVKYRSLLGGYVSVNQLTEVYGMPPETIELIRNRVYIDSTAIRRIRIDSASFSELLRHPYLEYEEVKALLEYREFIGDIRSQMELESNHILPDSTLYKIGGYLDYR